MVKCDFNKAALQLFSLTHYKYTTKLLTNKLMKEDKISAFKCLVKYTKQFDIKYELRLLTN